MKKVTAHNVLHTTSCETACPYCGEWQYHEIEDYGSEFVDTCEDCGKKYKILFEEM